MATTQKIFVLGTHTGVGKTIVSAVVAQALGATYWKPVHCGSSSDSDFIRNNTNCRVFESVFESNETGLVFEQVLKQQQKLKIPFKIPNVQPLVIEGLGGIFEPIEVNGTTLLDAVHPMEVDVVLVAETNSETINQVVLHCQNLQWLGFNVLGIVYNGPSNKVLEDVVVTMTGVQHKWHLPAVELHAEGILKVAKQFQEELKKWMK